MSEKMYDLLIKNGSIVDGSGAAAFIGDVAVKGYLIAEVATHIEGEAIRTIDASGHVVAPGFIDIHRHCDIAVFNPNFGVEELRQGITTVINGNCGLSVAPLSDEWRVQILDYLRPVHGILPKYIFFESFSEYLDEVEIQSLPMNFGMCVGNGTIRMAAVGFEKDVLDDGDYARIHDYLDDAITAGAFGVSLGLVYTPEGKYNVDTLCKALEPIRGSSIPIVTHIRGEGDLLIPSLEEVISVAKKLSIPLHISHFKTVGRRNWGHSLEKAIGLLDNAKAEGLRVTFDMYPWTAGCTQLIQLLPPEFINGGVAETIRRLKDPRLRKKCREIMEQPQTYFENLLYLVGWENIMIAAVQTEKNQPFAGKRVSEIAEIRGINPYDCAFDLLVEEECNVAMVNFIVCDEDIETILRLPDSIIVSDSIYTAGGKPHPRRFGTFPKVLSEYVREKKILSLEEAIHKFTEAPAKSLNIPNKGLLKKGKDADIAIFDPTAIKSEADYLNPDVMSTGFSHVFVNGISVSEQDNIKEENAGKILRRS